MATDNQLQLTMLDKVRENLGDCHRCKLSQSRTNIVFGEGDPSAPWMLVGEGPGEFEDLQGRPFVGKSGKLLDELIVDSGWNREAVYIANVVKCRPPGNRDPQEDEIEQCRPFLFQQIEAIKPVAITTLGKPAANLLLDCKEPMYKLRGQAVDLMGAKVVPTYHPSYILRGNWKKKDVMRQDFSKALSFLLARGIIPPLWEHHD